MLYLVPDGGQGMIYTFHHCIAAKLRFSRLVLHHRSFGYINSHSRLMAMLVQMCRAKATHVFLSNGMAAQFQARYGPVAHCIVSNARYVKSQAEEASRLPSPPSGGRIRIGHLSNLCQEKGFFDVAETFDLVVAKGVDAELHLAGPVVDDATAARLQKLQKNHNGRIIVHGPLYDAAKHAFYRALDVFLFPTRFTQEAAPNVVYEALAAGVPVISIERACIGEMVTADRGQTCPPDANFAEFAAKLICGDPNCVVSLPRNSQPIARSMADEAAESEVQYQSLLNLLMNSPAEPV